MKEYYSSSNKYLEVLQTHTPDTFKELLKATKEHIQPKSLVLDVGCGTKTSSKSLNDLGCHVVGMDISVLFLSDPKVRPNSHLNFIASSALKIPLSSESVDCIIAFDSVEHFVNVPLVFDEFDRVLKRNGKIIIFSPNYYSPFIKFQIMIRLIVKKKKDHKVKVQAVKQAMGDFLKSIYITCKKLANNNPDFIYRHPDLTEKHVVSADSDAVYCCHPVDIWKYFKKKNYIVLKKTIVYSNNNFRCAIKKLLGYFFPAFYFTTKVLLQKK